MAASRKSFRGGRPLKPRPCPHCGAPCASAVQAAAHCVGHPVGDLAAERPHAALPQLSPQTLRKQFPKWKYHRTEPAVIVDNPQAEADLGEGWADSPAVFEPEPGKSKRPEKPQKAK